MGLDRVLLVDDDEAFLDLMGLTLDRAGFEVDRASNGSQALDSLHSRDPYSVMVTDLFMPDRSGLELASEATHIDPHLPVILVTAGATLESAISALHDGSVYDYLVKPFAEKNQLLVAVQRAADHRRLVLEREALQARADAETARLQAVINATGDAILAANAGGLLTTVNPAAVRLLQQAQREGFPDTPGVTGSTGEPGAANFVGQPAASCLSAALAALITAPDNAGPYPARVEIRLDDGSIQAVTLTPLGAAGSHQGWMMVVHDISHLKQLDHLKSQLLVETARRINEPLLRSLDDLAALKALSRQGRVSEVAARLLEDWSDVQTWANSLMALSQVESSLNIRLSPVNLLEVIEEINRLRTEELSVQYALHLETQVPGCLPDLFADRALLSRLINVLLSRAAARSAPGGIISLNVVEHPGEIWIEVSDEGLPSLRPDAVDPFEITYLTAGSHTGITGLELAIVKAIVDRLAGRVWMEDLVPKGSSITFALSKAQENC